MLAALLAALASIVAIQPATADDRNAWQPKTITGMSPAHLWTTPNNVTATSCGVKASDTTAGQTVTTNGTILQRIPITQNRAQRLCPDLTAMANDGTVYAATAEPGGSTVNGIAAYRGSQQLWEIKLPCSDLRALVLGTNGAIYALGTCGNSQHLLGIKPPVSVSAKPTRVMDKLLGSFDPGYSTPLAAHKNGLVTRRESPNSGLIFVSYAGKVVQRSISNLASTYPAASTNVNGRSFVAIKSTKPCLTGGRTDIRIEAWTTTGRVLQYPLPACTYVQALRPVADGGMLAYLITNQVGKFGEPAISQQLTMIDSNGKRKWTNKYDPTNISVVNRGDVLFAPMLNGDVAVEYSFERSGYGVVTLQLLNGENGRQLDYVSFGGPDQGNGYYHFRQDATIDIANGRAYALLSKCSGQGPNNCESPQLHSIKLPEADIDYPRGAIMKGGVTTPSPRNCPKLQFVGVRGSGETIHDADGFGYTVADVKDRLTKAYPGMEAKAIDYEAVPVLDEGPVFYGGAYSSSLQIGFAALRRYLIKFAVACPRTPLAVFGYSQGAQVVGDTLGNLPSTIQPLIVVMGLFGDTRFNPRQSIVDAGDFNKERSGIYSFDNPRNIPSWLANRSRSTCAAGDPVCGQLNIPALAQCWINPKDCTHTQYISRGWTAEAAAWAQERINERR